MSDQRPSTPSPPSASLQRFAELSARAFEHPADRAALAALRKLPGFDAVLRKILGLLGERSVRLAYLAGAVRVSERQLPEVHRAYQECAAILDVREPPELFVTQTPFINAGAIGADRPIIVLNSAVLSLFDQDELRFILGHELGHVVAEHVLFKTMLAVLLKLSSAFAGVPVGSVALFAVSAALAEWDRKSELSCDRAGLLCLQDPARAYAVAMKVAGGVKDASMDLGEFERQAREYEAAGSTVDSAFKLLTLLGMHHPFHAVRFLELRRWVEAGEYQRILDGDYARRSDDPKESVVEEMKASAQDYQERYAESSDHLIRSMRELTEEVSREGANMWRHIKAALKPDK